MLHTRVTNKCTKYYTNMKGQYINIRTDLETKIGFIQLAEKLGKTQSQLAEEMIRQRLKAEDMIKESDIEIINKEIADKQKQKNKLSNHIVFLEMKKKELQKKAEDEKLEEFDVDAYNREMGLIPQ